MADPREEIHQEDYVIDACYRIVDAIGRGRKSVVYLARCLPSAPLANFTSKPVAIKVLQNTKASEAEELAKREAEYLLALVHPNIISLIDYVASDSLSYVVTEWASGGDLSSLVNRAWDEATAVERLCESLRYAQQLYAGLAHIHGKGILHRDIKPENILLTDKGVIKIADFGIAGLQHEEKVRAEIRRGVGTFHYLSPEALSDGWVDHRSDLYAAAVTLYQMICGRTPFLTESLSEQIEEKLGGQHRKIEFPDSELTESLDSFFEAAFSADLSERYLSANACLDAIEKVLSCAQRQLPAFSGPTPEKNELIVLEEQFPAPLVSSKPLWAQFSGFALICCAVLTLSLLVANFVFPLRAASVIDEDTKARTEEVEAHIIDVISERVESDGPDSFEVLEPVASLKIQLPGEEQLSSLSVHSSSNPYTSGFELLKESQFVGKMIGLLPDGRDVRFASATNAAGQAFLAFGFKSKPLVKISSESLSRKSVISFDVDAFQVSLFLEGQNENFIWGRYIEKSTKRSGLWRLRRLSGRLL